MNYYERIRNLIKTVPVELVDFSMPRDVARIPTQASSNFITNKEQGDWAEKLVFRAINDNSRNYVAVRYGKSDDLIAGDKGFDKFFDEFQEELDTIGKRPDLLVFRRADFDEQLGYDISHISHNDIDSYVRKAIAGIEVRSSAFLISQYDREMQERMEMYKVNALALRDKILSEYQDLLQYPQRMNYIEVLKNINENTLSVTDFKVPGWRSTARLAALNDLFKELKHAIKETQKRDYLSITPKVEDLKVVYKWIETFNVPHFYFQVFFDKVYGMSFERILEIISDENNDGVIFSVEADTKNQNKTTIKIKSNEGEEIAFKVDEPAHKSVRKEMDRGRLLFYVTFEGGTAYLDIDKLTALLRIPKGEF